MENIKKTQKTLKQSQNQPYNNCNLKTKKMENQTTINYLENQVREAHNTFCEKQQKYHNALPAICTASNWEEWDIAIEGLKGSTEQPSFFRSSVLKAWDDAEGFEFMKPRLLKRLFEDYDSSVEMHHVWKAGRKEQIERLKLEQLTK